MYAVGYTDAERRRLMEQAELFGPYTRTLFDEAGIRPGMRVLDVGCGVGDVALLAGSFVGPTGQVLGVDNDLRSLRLARERAEQAGAAHVQFIEGDLRDLEDVEPFDAVVGRFILMYLGNPAAALRGLAAHLRPGGIVAFQEFQFEYTPFSTTPIALWDEWMRLFLTTFRQARVDTAMGMHLHRTFVEAGLPSPQVHMDVHVTRPGDNEVAFRVPAHVLRSILPVMEKFGIATARDVDLDTFAARYSAEVHDKQAAHMSVPVVRAWARLPPA